MEQENKSGQKRILGSLMAQVGVDNPDYGEIGKALLDMSQKVIEGVGDTRAVDRLRKNWSSQTSDGINADGARDGSVRAFQADIESIAGLRAPFDSYAFYLPGSSGLIRVGIDIDRNGNPRVSLIDDGNFKAAKDNFDKLC